MIVLTVTLWQLALIVYFLVGFVGLIIVCAGETAGAVRFQSGVEKFHVVTMIFLLWPYFVYKSMLRAAAEEEKETEENSPENK